jgi:hypothetical protein
MIRDIIITILEILMLCIEIPIIIIIACILGIVYFFYVIYEFIKTFIFNK